jgi:hypothetical protein
MLLREVAGDDQHGFRGVEIFEGGKLAGLAAQRVDQRNNVAGAVVIDAVGAQRRAGELLQQIVLFVGRTRGADDTEIGPGEGLELFGYQLERTAPTGRFELAGFVADERRLQPFGVLREVERVTALDAEELAVDAALVAVVAADDLVVADAEGGFAAVRASPRGASCSGRCPRSANRPGRCRYSCRTRHIRDGRRARG